MIGKSGDTVYSMPVTNEVMDIWGTDADGLFRDGMEHLTEHSHFFVNGICHFISRLLEGEPGAELEKKSPEERLSDSVYCFNSESGEVELAEEGFREV